MVAAPPRRTGPVIIYAVTSMAFMRRKTSHRNTVLTTAMRVVMTAGVQMRDRFPCWTATVVVEGEAVLDPVQRYRAASQPTPAVATLTSRPMGVTAQRMTCQPIVEVPLVRVPTAPHTRTASTRTMATPSTAAMTTPIVGQHPLPLSAADVPTIFRAVAHLQPLASAHVASCLDSRSSDSNYDGCYKYGGSYGYSESGDGNSEYDDEYDYDIDGADDAGAQYNDESETPLGISQRCLDTGDDVLGVTAPASRLALGIGRF